MYLELQVTIFFCFLLRAMKFDGRGGNNLQSLVDPDQSIGLLEIYEVESLCTWSFRRPQIC